MKTVSLKPFIYKMMILPTKTGSGQTQGKLKTRPFYQVQREQEQQEKWEAEVLLLFPSLLTTSLCLIDRLRQSSAAHLTKTSSGQPPDSTKSRRLKQLCVCPLQDLFEAVLARPATFHYELERLYGKPFGDPSEATPTTWLPRLVRKRFRVWFLVPF